MANCRQACQYNTLGGCKVKEYNAICPLTNMATPITEYKMTNADRIRAMTDEDLADFLAYTWATSARAWQKDTGETLHWLKQRSEGE